MKANKVKNNQSIITSLTHGLSFAQDAAINTAIIRRYRNYDFLYEINEDDTDVDNTAILNDVIFKWSDYFNQLWKTRGWTSTVINTDLDYNPIENYRRHETTTTDGTFSNTDGGQETNNTDIDYNAGITQTTTPNLTTTTTPRVSTTTTPNLEISKSGTSSSNNTGASQDSNYNTGYASGDSEALTSRTAHVTTSDQTSGTTSETSTETGSTTTTQTGEDTVSQTGTQTVANSGSDHTDNVTTTTFGKTVANTHEDETTILAYGNIGVTTSQQMIEAERQLIINYTDAYVAKFAECFDINFYPDPEDDEEE